MTGHTNAYKFQYESFTFPFNVVAANSFASAVASIVDRIECVNDQASGYVNVSMIHMWITIRIGSTYGLLEPLKVFVRL